MGAAQWLRLNRYMQNVMKSLIWFKKHFLAGAAIIVLATMTATADDKKPAPIPDKLTTCPVSGDKLGEMDKPFIFEYKGREVKLCCKDCKKDFDKDPAKYMKKITDADKDSKDKAK
jgi:YHS domain-containing protein